MVAEKKKVALSRSKSATFPRFEGLCYSMPIFCPYLLSPHPFPEKNEMLASTHLRCFGARCVSGDVNVAPVIWCYQPFCIGAKPLHTWFHQNDIRLLLDGEPGNIVYQLLFDIVIGLQADLRILHDVSLFHLLLQCLLRGCIRAMVLTKAHTVLGCTLVELERCPVVWIRVVSAPARALCKTSGVV